MCSIFANRYTIFLKQIELYDLNVIHIVISATSGIYVRCFR